MKTGFTAKTIASIRRQSHFSCCLCFSKGIHIHHITPKSEGGTNKPENAAPLCPSCHETFGHNQNKRTMIIKARNEWYKICHKRFLSTDRVASLENRLSVVEKLLEKKKSPDKISDFLNIDQLFARLCIATHLQATINNSDQLSTISLLHIFLEKRFWYDSELRTLRKNILKEFGIFLTSKILLQALHDCNIKIGYGLSSSIFIKVLNIFQINVLAIVNRSFLGIKFGLNKKGNLLFQMQTLRELRK